MGVAVGVGDAVADAAARDEEFAVADAFGDDEVELVHPAAATLRRSAAHIAIIAACFFIKSHTSGKWTFNVNKEKLSLSYIRFLYVTSFHVTPGGYLPRRGAPFVFLDRFRHSWIIASEACNRLKERCFDPSDDRSAARRGG